MSDSDCSVSRGVRQGREDIEAAKIPIANACKRLGIEVTKSGHFLCPAHGDTGKKSKVGNAHIVKGKPSNWTCFACKAGGSAIDLYMAVNKNMDIAGAVAAISGSTFSTSNPPPAVKAKPAKAKKPEVDYSDKPGHATFEECLESYKGYAVSKKEADPKRFVVHDDYTETFKRVRFFHRETGVKIGPIPFEVHRNGRWYAAQDTTDPERLLPLYGGRRLADIGPLVTQVIVEGEKKADIINSFTSETFPFVAVASANGGSAAKKTDWSELRGDRKILIWSDNDKTGREYRDTVAKIILSSAKWNDVRIVQGEGVEAVDDLLDGLAESDPETTILSYISDNSARVRSTAMSARLNGGTAESEVEPEDLDFLLKTPGGHSLFPLRRLTMLAGDGGTGKSLFLKYMVRSIVDELDFFHYTINPELSGGLVCYLSQDEVGTGPRAHVKSIGCNRIDRMWVPGETGADTMTEACDQIKRYLADLPNERLALVVFDTGDEYLSDASKGNNDGVVKKELTAIVNLAYSTGAAAVVVKHFSKAKISFKDRVMGSAAWSNKPRQLVVIARSPASEEAFLGIGKSNVGPWPVSCGYLRLRRRGEGVIPELSLVPTDDEYIAVEARIIEQETSSGKPSSIKTWPNDQIITWILRTIREAEDGKISGTDLEQKSREANIPMDRFKSTRAELKANKSIAQTHPKQGSIRWFIPEQTLTPSED